MLKWKIDTSSVCQGTRMKMEDGKKKETTKCEFVVCWKEEVEHTSLIQQKHKLSLWCVSVNNIKGVLSCFQICKKTHMLLNASIWSVGGKKDKKRKVLPHGCLAQKQKNHSYMQIVSASRESHHLRDVQLHQHKLLTVSTKTSGKEAIMGGNCCVAAKDAKSMSCPCDEETLFWLARRHWGRTCSTQTGETEKMKCKKPIHWAVSWIWFDCGLMTFLKFFPARGSLKRVLLPPKKMKKKQLKCLAFRSMNVPSICMRDDDLWNWFSAWNLGQNYATRRPACRPSRRPATQTSNKKTNHQHQNQNQPAAAVAASTATATATATATGNKNLTPELTQTVIVECCWLSLSCRFCVSSKSNFTSSACWASI